MWEKENKKAYAVFQFLVQCILISITVQTKNHGFFPFSLRSKDQLQNAVSCAASGC